MNRFNSRRPVALVLVAAIVATVTYVGGTGRFAHARGTASFFGQLLPDGSIEVATRGIIDY